MIKDKIKTNVGRWSLDRVQFLLTHIGDFIDDESQELMQRARQFVAESGLDKLERLVECNPSDPELPVRVIESLSVFFSAGCVIQRGYLLEDSNWWVTNIFWRGHVFHLDLNDQVRANSLIPEVTPMQINKANAQSILKPIKMDFLASSSDTEAFFLKPTPGVAFLLLSDMPAPWAIDQITHAHRLVNKAFIF